MTFNIGDVVELPSGGVWATVIETHANGDVSVTWFDPEASGFGQVRLPSGAFKAKEQPEKAEPIRSKIAKLTRGDS